MARDENYDPNAPIVFPPGHHPEPFQDLSSPPSDNPAERVLDEFGQLKVTDVPLAFFPRAGLPVVEGEYNFSVEVNRLKGGLETTGVTTSRDEPFDKVKLVILRDQLKLQTLNRHACFSECLVPLAAPSSSLPAGPENDRAPTLVFDHELLSRIVSLLPADLPIVDFCYEAATQMLRFRTPNPDDPTAFQKDFRLTCWALSDFPAHHMQGPQLANPRFIGKIDPITLREAVRYAAIFATKEETRANLGLSELRGGQLFAGNQRHMGRIESRAALGVDLKIQFKALATLGKILARFDSYEVSVYESERYNQITNERVSFGFERYHSSFPDVTDMYRHESTNYCLVPRKQFIASLALLEAVNKDRDLLVHMVATGEGNDARLDLETRERCGQPCRDFLRVRRDFKPGQPTSEPLPDWRFSVEIGILLKLVLNFDDASAIHLEVLNNAALYVFDGDGTLDSHSLLAFMTEAQVLKRNEQKARMAAAGRRTAVH